jgi:hypothetical protein
VTKNERLPKFQLKSAMAEMSRQSNPLANIPDASDVPRALWARNPTPLYEVGSYRGIPYVCE